MLPERINELKGEIIRFASLIEQMVDRSVKGLVNREERLLMEVLEKDEPRANRYEVEIDELCTSLIAQFQPRAKDLRIILMIYNINGSLERMGDHTVNIAESALELIKTPPIKRFIDIPRMNELVKKMLGDIIKAFIDEDPALAREVCARDDTIDGLRDQIMRELITFMTENPAIIGTCLQIIRIAENLERIADLTTNISENIIFISQGKVIKHHLQNGKDM